MEEGEEGLLFVVNGILIFLKFASAFFFLLVLFVVVAALLDSSQTFRNIAMREEIWIRQLLADPPDQ